MATKAGIIGQPIGSVGNRVSHLVAASRGIIVTPAGKFQCPDGTPGAGEFTDAVGSTCALPSPVKRVRPVPGAGKSTATADFSALAFRSGPDMWADGVQRKGAVSRSDEMVAGVGRVRTFRCPPGTLNGGQFSNAMGTNCNIPARGKLQGLFRLGGKPKEPKPPKGPGFFERLAGRLAGRAESAEQALAPKSKKNRRNAEPKAVERVAAAEKKPSKKRGLFERAAGWLAGRAESAEQAVAPKSKKNKRRDERPAASVRAAVTEAANPLREAKGPKNKPKVPFDATLLTAEQEQMLAGVMRAEQDRLEKAWKKRLGDKDVTVDNIDAYVKGAEQRLTGPALNKIRSDANDWEALHNNGSESPLTSTGAHKLDLVMPTRRKRILEDAGLVKKTTLRKATGSTQGFSKEQQDLLKDAKTSREKMAKSYLQEFFDNPSQELFEEKWKGLQQLVDKWDAESKKSGSPFEVQAAKDAHEVWSTTLDHLLTVAGETLAKKKADDEVTVLTVSPFTGKPYGYDLLPADVQALIDSSVEDYGYNYKWSLSTILSSRTLSPAKREQQLKELRNDALAEIKTNEMLLKEKSVYSASGDLDKSVIKLVMMRTSMQNLVAEIDAHLNIQHGPSPEEAFVEKLFEFDKFTDGRSMIINEDLIHAAIGKFPLTVEQRALVDRYQDGDYQEWNSFLWNSHYSNSRPQSVYEKTLSIMIDNLDKSMKPLPENLGLWRTGKKFSEPLQEGEEYVFPAFLSTSAASHWGAAFTGADSDRQLWFIRTSKGTRGMSIYNQTGSYVSESEVLLAPGQRLKFVRTDKYRNNLGQLVDIQIFDAVP